MLHEGDPHGKREDDYRGGPSSFGAPFCPPVSGPPTADGWQTLALRSIFGRLLCHLKLILSYPTRLRSTASGAQPRRSHNKRSTGRGEIVPVRPSILLFPNPMLQREALKFGF